MIIHICSSKVIHKISRYVHKLMPKLNKNDRQFVMSVLSRIVYNEVYKHILVIFQRLVKVLLSLTINNEMIQEEEQPWKLTHITQALLNLNDYVADECANINEAQNMKNTLRWTSMFGPIF